MFEQRQQPRNRVYYGGMVAFNDRSSTFACVVRNFNMFGAKIEFEGAALVPDEVDFEIGRKGISCLARMVWRNRDEAGLVFANVHETARRRSAGLGAKAARDRTDQPETPVARRSASIRALDHMSTVEGEDAAILAAAAPPKVRRRRRLRAILLAVFTAQYTIVAILVSLSVAGILRYQVTPQIVEKFEAIAAALKRLDSS